MTKNYNSITEARIVPDEELPAVIADLYQVDDDRPQKKGNAKALMFCLMPEDLHKLTQGMHMRCTLDDVHLNNTTYLELLIRESYDVQKSRMNEMLKESQK